MFGYRVWPGIVIGSFLVNLSVSVDTTSAVSIAKSLSIALSIGLGSACQAILGALLIRRAVARPIALDQDWDVLKFLLLGGPVSCLLNATWGSTTLLIADLVTIAAFPFTWWTWWVGDTIGVLILSQLTIIGLGKPRELWERRMVSVAVPLAIAFAACVTVFYYMSEAEQHRIRLEFEKRAESVADTLRHRVGSYLEVVQSITRFYDSSEIVTRQGFQSFVAQSLTRYQGIQALEWIPRVSNSDRETYEEAARRDGFSDFQITERAEGGQIIRAGQRDEYYPVYFVEPYQENEKAVGFDLASNPSRRAALIAARDTGQLVATARITLVQESGRQFGFLVFAPVYEAGMAHDTVEARGQLLYGYGLGVFRIGDMVERALASVNVEGMEFRLLDVSAAPALRLLYANPGSAQESASARSDDSPPETNALYWVSSIEVGGRTWEAHISPTLAYMTAQRTWNAWIVLAGGLLFTGLLGAFLSGPEPARSVATLHHCSHRQPGVLAALAAAQDARAVFKVDRLSRRAAVRAGKAVSPAGFLQVGGAGRIIGEKSLELG